MRNLKKIIRPNVCQSLHGQPHELRKPNLKDPAYVILDIQQIPTQGHPNKPRQPAP